ncbi:MAG TPA: hypothetical protein PKA06_01675, partial [Gemmatales bacterium]|nr:hypothetical protein [Gemmatales bacterium]
QYEQFSSYSCSSNHPIFSYDRHDWVPPANLRLGEKVSSIYGSAMLSSQSQRKDRKDVYNFEVHRCHAYMVTQYGILAHNTGVACGPQLHDIIPYSRRAPGFQKHHGVLDQWASSNVPGYNGKNAPTVVMTIAEHNITRRIFGQWSYNRTGSINGPIVWSTVSNREMQALSKNMFDAAGLSRQVQADYFSALTRFLYSGSW